MVLRSLKNRLRRNFNISIIEMDDQDKWQKSTLALATIGAEKTKTDSLLAHIINYLDQDKLIQLLDYETEII